MASERFTGRTRRRTTSRFVHIVDHVARWVIVAGGIGTIVAVSLVCFFLVWVVAPLFLPAGVSGQRQAELPAGAGLPLRIQSDGSGWLGWAVMPDGALHIVRLDTGEVVHQQQLFDGARPTASAFSVDGKHAAFGFADGKLRLAALDFKSTLVETPDVPERARKLEPGEFLAHEQGIVARTAGGRFRVEKVEAAVEAPLELPQSKAVKLIDSVVTNDGALVATLLEGGALALHAITKRENLLSGDVEHDLQSATLPLKLARDQGPPDYLRVSADGDMVFVAWRDGRLLRFATGDLEHPALAEEVDLLESPDARLTALEPLVGRSTLMAGDSLGGIQAWFCARPPRAQTPDGARLMRGHVLPASTAAVTTLCASPRDRVLVAGYADGSLQAFYVTSERLLVRTSLREPKPIRRIAVAPSNTAIVALTDNSLCRWEFNPEYPEVSLSSLFLPMWYEGYDRPQWVWQSSSSSEGVEPKLSLVPLVFGTLKATWYSLLFGVPIALLAAVYTSEFLSPGVRARVKPTIEMMASLPSVVLGFLAGLVVAPFVEDVAPAIVACVYAVPLTFVAGAYLWQLIPQSVGLRLAPARFLFICAALPVGVLLGMWLGPLLERVLFAGDFRSWLDGRVGGPTAGWLLLLLPACGLFVAWVISQHVNPMLRQAGWPRSRWGAALFDALKFVAGVVSAVGIAWLLGLLLSAAGFDVRGSSPEGNTTIGLVGTYVQRNALVVGFMMGFAIIPIIYTVADDALSTVPQHLRSASLGAGATQWQTATRIIIPTAMSGLFSAVMIGLGRAVGETMIVLMAAGNTPILDWNVFNGFQTLSALIATEMPEAVRNSTHYRTLFLAALTLFALTFIINTLAEVIRLRFRRRAYEL